MIINDRNYCWLFLYKYELKNWNLTIQILMWQWDRTKVAWTFLILLLCIKPKRRLSLSVRWAECDYLFKKSVMLCHRDWEIASFRFYCKLGECIKMSSRREEVKFSVTTGRLYSVTWFYTFHFQSFQFTCLKRTSP